jgi:hypothetical protein
LIYETDAKPFASMMKVTWQSCGRNHPDKDTMSYWFNKLSSYELAAVEKAFDEWLKSQDDLPTIHQIIKLCQHKVTIHARLPSPLAIQDNKRHINEVQTYIAKNIKPTQDMRAWARKIIDNPSRYPDISFKIAKEALAAKYHN